MRPGERSWAFLTSHAVVLLEVSRNPDVTVREIAKRVGLTERQAHRVLADLVEADYVDRRRLGRRNHYRVNSAQPMRRSPQSIGEFLKVLQPTGELQPSLT